MSVRQRMTMRALIERDAASIDDYGSPGPPDWQIVGIEVPCFVWHGAGRARITSEQQLTMDAPGGIFPLETDITAKDRLRMVTNRQGTELFGMMYIDAVMRRKDHLGVRLREYS